MASNTGVRTELYRDQFGILLEDLSNRMGAEMARRQLRDDG